MALSATDRIYVAAGAIRNEARKKNLPYLTEQAALEIWAELNRTSPTLYVSEVYRNATENQAKRVVQLASRGYAN